jgi:hypothetical protein
MKLQKTLLTLALMSSAAITGTAQASLFDRGNGLIYNDATNTTWAKDANLFQTQAAGNANLVADIIAANNGVIHDTPSYNGPVVYSGTYTLTSADFTTSIGTMDWWGAQAWIGYLNQTSYNGYSDWRLPAVFNAIYSFNPTDSEMSELFYNELGGLANSDISITHNANYNLFTNVQSGPYGVYWTGKEALGAAFAASDFVTFIGLQSGDLKSQPYYAWAVRPGDVAAVPVPGAVWIFGSGLLGLLGFKRRVNMG